MATLTENKKSLKDLLGVELEEVTDTITLRSNRGRTEGADVIALREIFQSSMKGNKPNAFPGLSDKAKRDTVIRKIRQAASKAGPNGEKVDVATLTDYDKGVVYWGTKEAVAKLQGKSQTA